jgi:uncharacterized protein
MPAVRNNSAEQRYELEVDGVTAFVTYRRDGSIVSLNHTEVPPELAGRGVGSQLAQGTLDQVRSEGLKVVPKCSFIVGYIAKHPEYQDLVASR